MIHKLKRLLDAELTFVERDAFARMLDDLEAGTFTKLTPRQQSWANGVYKRLELDVGDVENLYSSGKIEIGNPVATPAVLCNLPKKPPRKK